jgi:predicted Zn-dependent protease with MMP-like domain
VNEAEFKALAEAVWLEMPEKFKERIRNVALLVEDEPDAIVRREEDLKHGETLLGLYRGVPNTVRGSEYGVGGTLPDTITLYRLPILDEAQELTDTNTNEFPKVVKQVVEDTIWHEVGHYFGFDEEPLQHRENEGTNRFES